MSDTAAKASAAISPTDTGVAAAVPPPITSVTSSLGSIPAREGLILEHVKPETIFPGPSRSGEVKLDFDRTGYNVDRAQELLQQKHFELLKNGYTTLIGRVAKDVACGRSDINKNKTATITFTTPYGNDIIVLGYRTYEEIIKNMHDNGECSARTAFYILKNLSKGYEKPDPKNSAKKIERSDYELFSDLPENAKNLMAVLICEAIRFQEDGALERMAIRKVLSLFPKPSTPSVSTTSATASSSSTTEGPVAEDYSDVQPSRDHKDNPFYKVFVLDEDTTLDEATPLAIFAAIHDGKVGGKRRKLDLIEGKSYKNNVHYRSDQKTFLYMADCLSDSEEQKKRRRWMKRKMMIQKQV